MRISGGKSSHGFDPLCLRSRSLKCSYAFKIKNITTGILLIEENFTEIVKVGEAIEDGIKIEKFSRIAAPTES